MKLREFLDALSPAIRVRLCGEGEIVCDYSMRVATVIERDEYGEFLMNMRIGYITQAKDGTLNVFLD